MPRRLRHDSGSATTAGRAFVTADLHPHPVRARPWSEIHEEYLAAGLPGVRPVLDVVESIVRCGAAERLVGWTSMFDLHVATRLGPAPASGVDVLAVHTIGSQHEVAADEVLMRHVARSGLVEEVRRPAADAVPLFWRLATEKWGVAPWRWDTLTDAQRQLLQEASGGAAGPGPSSPAVSAPLDDEVSALRRLGQLLPAPETEIGLTPPARPWVVAHGSSSAVAGGTHRDPR